MFESFRTNQTVRSNSQDLAMRTAETVRTSENDKNKLETPLANSRAGQQSMSGPSLADSEAGRETMNAPSLANSRAGRESMGEISLAKSEMNGNQNLKSPDYLVPLNLAANGLIMKLVDKYAQVLQIDPPANGAYSAKASLYSSQKELKSAMKGLKMDTSKESVQEAWDFYQALSSSKDLEITATVTRQATEANTRTAEIVKEGSSVVRGIISTRNDEYSKLIEILKAKGGMTQEVANALYKGGTLSSGESITPSKRGDGWVFFENTSMASSSKDSRGHIMIDLTNLKEEDVAKKLIQVIPQVFTER